MSPLDAKKIIECLAHGADPDTGEALSEQSPFNDPQVIRAMFVALEALEKLAKREQRGRNLPHNAGNAWSDAEDKDLLADFDHGLPVKDLAAKHGRTQGAIASRLVRLGRIKERDEVYSRTPLQE
ncbi:MAG: hypothetical protein DMG21_19695 [Acidobacteria bacterium]|nr:MAG: hypothetical protein DMG21_19695 [Acidobacteriota bacterium]